jgi:hypothetical protein
LAEIDADRRVLRIKPDVRSEAAGDPDASSEAAYEPGTMNEVASERIFPRA